MTELDFLLELLLNHKLPRPTKQAIKDRIGAIQGPRRQSIPISTYPQAPSTQVLLDQMANDPINVSPVLPPAGAVTFAAQKALADRQKLIQDSINGREDKSRVMPRKF